MRRVQVFYVVWSLPKTLLLLHYSPVPMVHQLSSHELHAQNDVFIWKEKKRQVESSTFNHQSHTAFSEDDVHGRDSLSLGALSVSDGITDAILQKHL